MCAHPPVRDFVLTPSYRLAALFFLFFWSFISYSQSLYHVSTPYPAIALTFDDGPKPDHLDTLLGILKTHQIKATFFVVGQSLDTYPDLGLKIYSAGHELGNHSYSHPDLTQLSTSNIQQELALTSQLISKITGETPLFFRPPGGRYSRAVEQVALDEHLIPTFWDVNAGDYAESTEHGVENALNLESILDDIRPGSIVLLHNGNPYTMSQLPRFISHLQSRGFFMVTLSELMRYATP